MHRLQFPLRSILFAVALAALGLTALTRADQVWEIALLACTTALLFIGVAFVVIRRGNGRLFWFGFAVTGWSYSVLFFAPFLLGGRATIRSFPTTRLLMLIYENFVGNPTARLRPPFGEEFVFIGQCLLTLLFALAGGFLARWVFWSPTSPAALEQRNPE